MRRFNSFFQQRFIYPFFIKKRKAQHFFHEFNHMLCIINGRILRQHVQRNPSSQFSYTQQLLSQFISSAPEHILILRIRKIRSCISPGIFTNSAALLFQRLFQLSRAKQHHVILRFCRIHWIGQCHSNFSGMRKTRIFSKSAVKRFFQRQDNFMQFWRIPIQCSTICQNARKICQSCFAHPCVI